MGVDMRRAQAAMEFLTTYGWMLLILVVVLTALVFLGLFGLPHLVSCSFPANFVCRAWKLTTDGNLTLDLYQNTGHNINVMGINCTKNVDAINPTVVAVNVFIKNSDHELVANGTNVQCSNVYGNNATGIIGSAYSGKLLVYYIDNDTGVPHLVVGEMTANYE